jgi:hypothetical protein
VQLSERGIVVLKVLSHGLVLLLKGAGSLVEEAALSAAGEAPTLVQLVLLLDDAELLLEELVLLVGLPHGMLLKSTGMLLEITGMLLKGNSLLLKKVSLLLKDLVLLLEITSILAKSASLLLESTDIHAKRSSGISDTLLDGMLDHGAHVIIGVNEVLLNRVGNSAALEGSVGSVVVALLSLDSLKIVVNATSDLLASLALMGCMALLDPKGNLIPKMDVRVRSRSSQVTTNAAKIVQRVEVLDDGVGIGEVLGIKRKLSVMSGFSKLKRHYLKLLVGVDATIAELELCGRVPGAVSLGCLGSGEECLDGGLGRSAALVESLAPDGSVILSGGAIIGSEGIFNFVVLVTDSQLLKTSNDGRHGLVVGKADLRLGVAVLESNSERSAKRRGRGNRRPHDEGLSDSSES